jgi:type 1 fimbria pilin
MKKSILFLTIAAGLLMAVTTSRLLAADAAKEVTITGKAVCAKCTLHEGDKCQTVIQAEVDGKTVNYYLTENDVSKAFHKNICSGPGEQVTATGTVKEKKGKEMLTVSKIEPVK